MIPIYYIYIGKSIKKLNKFVNIEPKNLVNWLNVNKISLNVKKTEMFIFKSKRKKLNDIVKIKLSGKRIYPTASVKYLGVKIDQHLTWQHHINDLSIKLNRANALHFKIRKFVDDKILRSILVFLNPIQIFAHLSGLNIIMSLIVLSFYRKKHLL